MKRAKSGKAGKRDSTRVAVRGAAYKRGSASGVREGRSGRAMERKTGKYL